MSTSVSPQHRPLRADAERNRQRLLRAAREVFAARGLDVALDDVARHAGVGVGTVYRRFANREELIEAVLDEGVRHVAQIAKDALTDDDPWAAFERFFLEATAALAEDRGLREILLLGGHGTGAALETAQALLTPRVDALIARAQRSGHLREDLEPIDFPMLQLMLGAASERSRDVAPGQWRRYAALLLDGLRTRRDGPTGLGAPALTGDEFYRSMTGPHEETPG
ncbi:TetR/AcrR family transcriptional regulator [Demequina iriomotensis]|uniref:TetR/AcrR family transcriptional regulator n=1 Tax=Demequina iriomotensis TaxID=1536641 RepID=UPI000781CF58|nr:TetR/AcrR family transcriptional regulator [Demequina iriomotensis]